MNRRCVRILAGELEHLLAVDTGVRGRQLVEAGSGQVTRRKSRRIPPREECSRRPVEPVVCRSEAECLGFLNLRIRVARLDRLPLLLRQFRTPAVLPLKLLAAFLRHRFVHRVPLPRFSRCHCPHECRSRRSPRPHTCNRFPTAAAPDRGPAIPNHWSVLRSRTSPSPSSTIPNCGGPGAGAAVDVRPRLNFPFSHPQEPPDLTCYLSSVSEKGCCSMCFKMRRRSIDDFGFDPTTRTHLRHTHAHACSHLRAHGCAQPCMHSPQDRIQRRKEQRDIHPEGADRRCEKPREFAA